MKKYYIRVISNHRYLLEWNGRRDNQGQLILKVVKDASIGDVFYDDDDLIPITEEEAMLEIL